MQLFRSIGSATWAADFAVQPICLDQPVSAAVLRGDPLQVPNGLGMVVGILCRANTDTKINKVYLNLITTPAVRCGLAIGEPRLLRRFGGSPQPKREVSGSG